MSGLLGREICTASAIALLAVACGHGAGNRADAGGLDAAAPEDGTAVDAAIPSDVSTLPGSNLDVSSSGDDANDGVTRPVRTLGRAISIATAHPEITSISMGDGFYKAATGESFPYTLPPNLTVLGPADGPHDGFAHLVGDGTQTGLILGSGKLQSLTLEGFDVAVVVQGAASLEALRVRSSHVAVREESAASLVASGLDIEGDDGACSIGLELFGDAALTVTEFVTDHLGTALQVRDRASATVSKAGIFGDGTCVADSFSIWTSGTFSLTDSNFVDGQLGLLLKGISMTAPLHASLTNVKVFNAGGIGIQGLDAIVQIAGGELSRNSEGLSIHGGSWSLTNVAIADNPDDGVVVFGPDDQSPATLTMRGCTITGNLMGIDVSDFAVVDLGTVESPGNNTFQFNTGVGVFLGPGDSDRDVSAVGNTWMPFVQGANKDGKYVPAVVPGPVDFVRGNNYSIRTATRRLKR